MKPVVLGIFAFLMLLLSGIAVATIDGKTTRMNELDQNLGTAMQQSMYVLKADGKYAIQNDRELVADMIQSFLSSTEPLSDVKDVREGKTGENVSRNESYEIIVHTVDYEKGILDVSVTRKYPRYGSMGEVSVRKMVVLDDHTDIKNTYHVVRFIEKDRAVKSGESGTEKLPSGEWVTKKDVIVKVVRVKHGEQLKETDFPSEDEYSAFKYGGNLYTKNRIGNFGENHADGFGILKDIDVELVKR